MASNGRAPTWITVDGPSPKGLTAVSLSSLLPMEWLDEAEQISPVIQAVYKSSASRSGKWSTEEVRFADIVIEQFALGLLRLKAHTTLRSVLSTTLQCDPMRISKKFPKSSSLGKKLFIPAASTVSNETSLEAEIAAADSARKTAFFDFLGSLDATGAPSKPASSSKGGKKRRRDSASDSAAVDELGAMSQRLSAGVAPRRGIASKPSQAPRHTYNSMPNQASRQNLPEYAYYGGFGHQYAYDAYGSASELHNSRTSSGQSVHSYHQQNGKPDVAPNMYYHDQHGMHYDPRFGHPGHTHGHFRSSQPPSRRGVPFPGMDAPPALGSLHLTPDVARALALQLLPILRDSQHGYGTAPAPADAPVMGGFAGAARSARPHQAPAPPTGPPEFAHIAGPSDMHLAAELASAASSRHAGTGRSSYESAGQRRYDSVSGRANGFEQPHNHMHSAPSRGRSDSASLDLDLLLHQGGPSALAALASHLQQPPRQPAARDTMPTGALHGDGGRYSPPQALPPRFSPSAESGGVRSPPRAAKHSPVQDRDAAETLRNMAEGTGSESSSRNAASGGDLDTAAL